MIKDCDIICFGPTDWWGMNPSCTTHIMRQFANNNRILYVNPFSSDLMGGKGRGNITKKGMLTRIGRKIRSLLKYIRHPVRNLYVFSPFFIPVQGNRCFDAINNFLLWVQLMLVSRLILKSRPILWMENIRASEMMEWFNPKLVIYHVSDLFAEDSYSTGVETRRKREEMIMQRSDLVICVSHLLYEQKRKCREQVFYLPHGVDFNKFRAAAESPKRYEPLRDVHHPIAGYFGTLTLHNDIELWAHCAQKLPHVFFVFAGQITAGDYSELLSLDNVKHLGRVVYEDIPVLCAEFDVCMLQWKMSDWIRYCNPLKMFEHMASGKPIVSVPIKEVLQYEDVISVTEGKEEFCRALEWEIDNDTPGRAQKRIEIARSHSWQSHVQYISELITNILPCKDV